MYGFLNNTYREDVNDASSNTGVTLKCVQVYSAMQSIPVKDDFLSGLGLCIHLLYFTKAFCKYGRSCYLCYWILECSVKHLLELYGIYYSLTHI